MKNSKVGFTLVEILVVVAIVALLSAFLYVNFSEARAQSRDVERRADLRELQVAVENYKLENGRYPEGCNGPTTNNSPVWSGQDGSGYECNPSDNGQYILGLVAGGFLPALPRDPKLNDSEAHSGYVYTVNENGSSYKIMALNTVETEVLNPTPNLATQKAHPFLRCGLMNSNGPCTAVRATAGTAGAYNTIDNSHANQCELWGGAGNDYAVYGGYATIGANETEREYHTDKIWCQ